MLRLLFCLLLIPAPLWADRVLTPQEFEAYANGKTLYFAQQGQPFGVEQYLPGRQSIWQFADGTCANGIWFARKNLICFVYDGDEVEQCWTFIDKDGTFAARALGREPEADLDVIWRDQAPISCKAPDLGV